MLSSFSSTDPLSTLTRRDPLLYGILLFSQRLLAAVGDLIKYDRGRWLLLVWVVVLRNGKRDLSCFQGGR